MEELKGISELISLGGNGAAIAGVWLAWKIFTRFESIMSQQRAEMRAIREAILVSNPEAMEVFAEHDRRANDAKLAEFG